MNKFCKNCNNLMNIAIISNEVKVSCNSCSYNEPITNGTLIMEDNNNTSKNLIFDNYRDYKYSSILPRTTQYKCIKNDCVSHKKNKDGIYNKEALFFKYSELSNQNIYICCICDAIWLSK